MCTVLITALTGCPSYRGTTGLETKKKLDSTEVMTNQKGNVTRTKKNNNYFIFRTCGITIIRNKLRTWPTIQCVTVGTPNITPPPHCTIWQLNLQIPIERPKHHTNKSLACNLYDPNTNNTISEPLIFYRLHLQMAISCSFIYINSNIKYMYVIVSNEILQNF